MVLDPAIHLIDLGHLNLAFKTHPQSRKQYPQQDPRLTAPA
jgi:hypothetical protein